MTEINTHKPDTFKYNMSFYYQSTIIYFVVFIIYVIIRGEFVEESFTLITNDPIIYFFGIIVLVSIISLLYNLYNNKHLEITENKIVFSSRSKTRLFNIDDIQNIRLSRERRRIKNNAFRLIRIKLKNRRRSVIIRPYDYENEKKLIQKFLDIKNRMEMR